MFEATVIKLLEGAFICNTVYPDLFSYLKDESASRQVNGYLTQIGRHLAVTPHGQAYYAAYQRIGKEERSEIKALFREIKHDIKPVLGFLNLVMQAQNSDRTLGAGDVIEFPKLLMRVSENSHLEEMLRGFPAMRKDLASNKANVRTLLDRLLQQMVKSDYLVADRRGDRFEVTGKIDYFYEVVDFIFENEQHIKEAQEEEQDPEGENRRLF